MTAYASTAIRELQRTHAAEVAARLQPGDWGCTRCGYIGPRASFAYGRGREYGQHPSVRYCPSCGNDTRESTLSYEHVEFCKRHPLSA